MKLKLVKDEEGNVVVPFDIDERAHINEFLQAVHESDLYFGSPRKSLLQKYGGTTSISNTSLKNGDVLWRTSKRRNEVINLLEEEEEEEVESSNQKKKKKKLCEEEVEELSEFIPMFYQNPIETLGVPSIEKPVTKALWDLIPKENLQEAYVLNFCVELENIVQKYFPQLCKVPVALCCGTVYDEEKFYEIFPSGSRLIYPKCPPYGTHHSKMFVLFYGEKGIRIIIHSSNLETTNLFMHAEGSWYQDFPLKQEKDVLNLEEEEKNKQKIKENGLEFQEYLIRILTHSGIKEAGSILSKYDFSTAEVALVPNLPNNNNSFGTNKAYETYSDINRNGLGRIRHLLIKECEINPEWGKKIKNWNIVIQGSSLGATSTQTSKFGNWFENELGYSFRCQKDCLQLVVVTKQEVENSLFGRDGARATFYENKTFQEESVRKLLCKWTPSNEFLPTRSQILPHIKTFFCYEPNHGNEIAWAMIGSHNCTKAAFGKWTSSNKDKLQCISYELSIMYLPSILKNAGNKRWSIVTGTWKTINCYDTFVPYSKENMRKGAVLPIPFHLPLTRYDFKKDSPFISSTE